MIYAESVRPPKRAGTRVSDTVPSVLPRSGESWLIVCVFVLMAVSVWFSGNEGSTDLLRGSLQEQVVWGIAYFGAAIGLLRCRESLGGLIRSSLPVIAIILLASLSTIWSTDPSITLKRAIGLLGTSAFAYYIAGRFKLTEFVGILGVTCYGIAILSFLAIVLVPSIGVMHDSYAGAWRGIFIDKNVLGEFMALSLLTFGVVIFSKLWPRRLAVIGAALSLALLVGSQSVSPLIICAVLLIAIALTVLYRRGSHGRLIALALGVSLFLIGLSALAGGLDGQFILNALGRNDTLTGRTDLWPQVVQAISNRPWLGYGYSAFWLPNGDFTYFISPNWTPNQSHNGYLEACLDVGVVGASTAVLAILVALRRGVASLDRHLASCYAWPLLAVIYFLAVNLTESSIAKYNNFNWIIFVVAFLYASQAAGKRQNEGRVRVSLGRPAMEAVRLAPDLVDG